MKRRTSIVVGTFLLAGIVLAIWATRGPREPVYEGRALSDWMNHHVASSAAVPPYGSAGWQKADQALRAIGTNAIPFLLENIQQKDMPSWVRKLAEFAGRYGVRIDLRP